MDKRFRIGLNYFFDNKSNSGVVNYIYNIISALKALDDVDRPQLVVFYSTNADINYLKEIEYPYISFILFKPYSSNFIVRKLNGIFRRLTTKDLYKQLKYFNKIDCLYPYFESLDYQFADVKNKVHWLVDFNNKAFPEHYDDKGAGINKYQEKITSENNRVVLSSNSLKAELQTYYPNHKCDIKVLRFASSIAKNFAGLDDVKRRYSLSTPFFMCPNQLWAHKNHIVILQALNIIKTNYPELQFKILFSGSLDVNRGLGHHIEFLRSKVEEYGIEQYIQFLGVIDRKDQLSLMKGANALLQPSLYEGWSTLVEECKALNQFILLSELPVHREQISENVSFFDPFNPDQLAEKIRSQLLSPAQLVPVDYDKNVRQFGRDILEALKFNS